MDVEDKWHTVDKHAQADCQTEAQKWAEQRDSWGQ